MQFLKRMIAMVLALALCVGMVPATAYARQNSASTSMNNDMDIKGTNGFGTLLSKKMQQHQRSETEAQEDYTEGYCVSDLTVSGNTATVEYCALEDAVLTVAIYSEDGLQLITSGTAEVSAEDTIAEVTLEGQLPEYFMASAFLMDGYDFSPLCAEYATSMYTREMQQLLKSTVDDYPAELVLNLDGKKDTNFAVYAEGIKIIEASAGVNEVIHEDHDTQNYVIANADEQITSLAVGDVFSYNYAENEYLIVKVASISVDGTTVTITGGDVEMEEVFTHVKIEMDSKDAEIVVDDSTAAPGIEFVGFRDQPQTFALEDADRKEMTLEFNLFTLGDDDSPITLEGTLTTKFGTYLEYYLALTRVRIKCEIDVTIDLNATLEAKTGGALDRAELPIGFIGFSWMGLTLDLTPELVLELSGEVTIGTTVQATFGVDYDDRRKDELIRISKKPVWDVWKLEAEVSLFFGIDLAPELNVISEDIAGIELGATVGVVISASVETGETIAPGQKAPESQHACKWCVSFELKLQLEIEGAINFLNIDFLSIPLDIGSWELPLGNMYYSIDKKEFGFDECPNLEYRLTLYIVDEDGKPLYAAVRDENDEILGNANDQGTLVLYVPAGNHTFKLSHMMRKATKIISVTKASLVKITLKEGNTVGDLDYNKPGSGIGGALGKVETEDYQDLGTLVDTGKCGESAYWDLYSSGIMLISGSGYVDDSASYKWYVHRNEVRGLVIGKGIESFDYYAFNSFTELISVAIPGSVRQIPEYAFGRMQKLRTVRLGEGVTSIGDDAFTECSALTSITLPESLTYIGDSAFYMCAALKSIDLPSKLEKIENCAFWKSGLTSLECPTGLREIGELAFSECKNLTRVELNNGLVGIGGDAFRGSGITSLVIPGSVRNMGQYAFGLTPLKSVVIQPGVTTVGERVFAECSALSRLVLADSVSVIGSRAFDGCLALQEIEFPAALTTIGDLAFDRARDIRTVVFKGDAPVIASNAFSYLKSAATAYYPANNETWTEEKIQSYGNRFTWIPYTRDENGEMVIAETASVMSVADDAVLLEAVPEVTEPVDIPEETQSPAVDETAEEAIIEPVSAETPELYAIYPGEYETVANGAYDLKKASFTGLIPGEEYILLALASLNAENPLSSDNLLYITQGTAESNGTLKFQYVLPKNAGASYVMACGPSNRNLKDATITFPEMYEDGEFQTVNPTVAYGGKVLTEGIDYEITGDVCFFEAGTYSCTITGMYQYAGSVTCEYTVKTDECSHTGGSATCCERAVCDLCGRHYGELDTEAHRFESGSCILCGAQDTTRVPGDIDENGTVDVDDVLALLWYVLFPEDYPIDAEADFDHNGSTDVDDVLTLLWYVLFPEDYPLN